MNIRHPHFKEVMRQDAERERLANRFVAYSRAVLARLRQQAFREGPAFDASAYAHQLANLVKLSMVSAHVAGRRRVYADLSIRIRMPLKLDLQNNVLHFLQDRFDMDREQLMRIDDTYANVATRFESVFGSRITRAIQQSTIESVQANEHVMSARHRLAKHLEAQGVSASRPYLLETIVRTQMQIAYSAGRANAMRDQAIQQILWGYEYVTVGDDRVRSSHAKMDGMRRKKSDAIWNSWTPPCGWNCRCSQVPILNHEKKFTRQTRIPKDVEPDAGFGKSWGQVFNDHLPSNYTFGKINKPITKQMLRTPVRQAWLKSLSQDQKNIILRWSRNLSAILRQAHRNPYVADPEQIIDLQNLASVIDTSPKFSGTVYRGMNKININSLKHLSVGMIFSIDSFASTSRDIRIAKDFASGGPINILYLIQSHDLVPVEDLVDREFEHEKEVIINKNRLFKITKIQHEFNGTEDLFVVSLRQVKDAQGDATRKKAPFLPFGR